MLTLELLNIPTTYNKPFSSQIHKYQFVKTKQNTIFPVRYSTSINFLFGSSFKVKTSHPCQINPYN